MIFLLCIHEKINMVIAVLKHTLGLQHILGITPKLDVNSQSSFLSFLLLDVSKSSFLFSRYLFGFSVLLFQAA